VVVFCEDVIVCLLFDKFDLCELLDGEVLDIVMVRLVRCLEKFGRWFSIVGCVRS